MKPLHPKKHYEIKRWKSWSWANNWKEKAKHKKWPIWFKKFEQFWSSWAKLKLLSWYVSFLIWKKWYRFLFSYQFKRQNNSIDFCHILLCRFEDWLICSWKWKLIEIQQIVVKTKSSCARYCFILNSMAIVDSFYKLTIVLKFLYKYTYLYT